MPNDSNGFDVWKNHILKELERLSDSQENMNKQMERLSVDLAMLRVKASVWGIMGGAIPVIVSLCVYLITRLK